MPSSELYFFGAPTYFRQFSLAEPDVRDLDFFAVVVPATTKPLYQHVVGLHAIAKEEKNCRFAIEDVAPPSVDEGYGFFGLVTPCHSGLFLEFQPQFEVGMSFLREGESGRLAFDLGSPHKGHDAYRGCSGAPIVDSMGRLVSLVIGGCQATNEIFGVPLHTYRSSIVACAMADSAPSG